MHSTPEDDPTQNPRYLDHLAVSAGSPSIGGVLVDVTEGAKVVSIQMSYYPVSIVDPGLRPGATIRAIQAVLDHLGPEWTAVWEVTPHEPVGVRKAKDDRRRREHYKRAEAAGWRR
jgi:hypothetical protein